MAKVGQGDDRWIVKEREDGSNVNGWHWQEKDCLPWSKERLGALLEGLPVVEGEDAVWLNVIKVQAVTGEAYVNVRKGKKIPGYEVEIKAWWAGEIRDGGLPDGPVIAKANGTVGEVACWIEEVHLPYVADENADEEPEIKISVAAEGPAFSKMREMMVSKGRKLLLEKINVWRTELHAGGPGGDAPAPAPNAPEVPKMVAAAAPEGKKGEDREQRGTHTIQLTERFICRPGDVFESYTNAHRIMAFTQSRAESEPRVGGRFSMFDGSVEGEYVEMVMGEKIVQKWRFSNWAHDVYSTVTIGFKEPEPGSTIVTLTQTGVPEEDKFGNHNVKEQTENGWRNLIFGRIRHVFGFGC